MDKELYLCENVITFSKMYITDEYLLKSIYRVRYKLSTIIIE